MKSKFLLILALLVITTISACSGQTTQTPTETAAPTAAIVQPTETTIATETSSPVPTNTQPAATATSSPTETPAAAAAVTTSVSFAKDVMPILESSCINCHGGEQVKEGLNMKTYAGLMTGSFNGAVIEPGNAANSFLIEQVVKGEMPKRGPKLTSEQIQIITDWINAGALNN